MILGLRGVKTCPRVGRCGVQNSCLTTGGHNLGFSRFSAVVTSHDADWVRQGLDGDQNTEAQEAALRAAGCVRVYTDQASGSKSDRPQLAAALEYLNAGDTLVVWRLDRLGRSLPHLVEVVRSLGDGEWSSGL